MFWLLIKRSLFFISIILGLLQTSCSFFNILNFVAYDLNRFGGITTNSNSAEELTERESQIVNSGAIEVDEVISNIKTPNLNLISINQIISPNTQITNKNLETERIIRIVGSEGAISDPNENTKIIGYAYHPDDQTTGTKVSSVVNPDGSFTINITSETDVIIANTYENNLISPLLHITQDPVTEIFSIITTNSESIVKTAPTAINDDGSYFVSTKNEKDQYSLIQLNTQGSLIQEIIQDDQNQIKTLSTKSPHIVVYSYSQGDQTGTLVYQFNSIGDTNNLNKHLVSFKYDLATITDYDPSQEKIKTYITNDENGVLLFNRTNKSLKYINIVSTNSIDIIPEDTYQDLQMAYDEENNAIFLWLQENDLYSLYKLELDNDPAFAWTLRETLIAFEDDYDQILSMDAKNNVVVYNVQSILGAILYRWSENLGNQLLQVSKSQNIYTNLKLTTDGSTMIACNTKNNANQLIYYHLNENSENEITFDLDFEFCSEDFGSYSVGTNFIHYIRSGNDNQHGLINLNLLN